MLYRIFTEDRNRRAVRRIVSAEFDGFTIIPSQGSWKGRLEKSLVIEIIGNRIMSKIKKLAQKIKKANEQESVLIEVIQNTDFLV